VVLEQNTRKQQTTNKQLYKTFKMIYGSGMMMMMKGEGEKKE